MISSLNHSSRKIEPTTTITTSTKMVCLLDLAIPERPAAGTVLSLWQLRNVVLKSVRRSLWHGLDDNEIMAPAKGTVQSHDISAHLNHSSNLPGGTNAEIRSPSNLSPEDSAPCSAVSL
jgi:hypothetical protein